MKWKWKRQNATRTLHKNGESIRTWKRYLTRRNRSAFDLLSLLHQSSFFLARFLSYRSFYGFGPRYPWVGFPVSKFLGSDRILREGSGPGNSSLSGDCSNNWSSNRSNRVQIVHYFQVDPDYLSRRICRSAITLMLFAPFDVEWRRMSPLRRWTGLTFRTSDGSNQETIVRSSSLIGCPRTSPLSFHSFRSTSGHLCRLCGRERETLSHVYTSHQPPGKTISTLHNLILHQIYKSIRTKSFLVTRFGYAITCNTKFTLLLHRCDSHTKKQFAFIPTQQTPSLLPDICLIDYSSRRVLFLELGIYTNSQYRSNDMKAILKAKPYDSASQWLQDLGWSASTDVVLITTTGIWISDNSKSLLRFGLSRNQIERLAECCVTITIKYIVNLVKYFLGNNPLPPRPHSHFSFKAFQARAKKTGQRRPNYNPNFLRHELH